MLARQTANRLAWVLLGCFGVAVVALADDSKPGPRNWSDKSGKYKVEATFKGVRDGKVQLEKAGGEVVQVPLDKLSEADQQYVRTQAKAAAGEDDNPFESKPDKPVAGIEEVVAKTKRAIVSIQIRDGFGRKVGLGSGFLIDPSGLVATNFHVIGTACAATAKFGDGKEIDVLGYRALDTKRDLAILQLKEVPSGAVALAIAPPGELRQGETVVAVGHPIGFEFSVSRGVLSATRKTLEMPEAIRATMHLDPECLWLQIDARLAPGNSGGPLLDDRGAVLGLNTWIIKDQNLGFAIHVKHLIDLRQRMHAEPKSFPVPGSQQGPAVTDAAVVDQLGKFLRDFEEYQRKVLTTADAKQREQILKNQNPTAGHMASLRKLAESGSSPKQKFEALAAIARLARRDDSDKSRETMKWAFEQLLEQHSDSESMGSLAWEAAQIPALESQDFLRRLLAKSTRRDVQGVICWSLAQSLAENPRSRGRHEEESLALCDRAVGEFGGIELGEGKLSELVQPLVSRLKHFSVSRTPPDIVGKDSKGQDFKLSEFQGKVVLVDFWADWSPLSQRLVAQERELLKRHADRPFAIVGVNGDTSERLHEAEASGNVTWRSWADGPGGPIARQWNVTGFPTLYLLDHRGRIRMKGGFELSAQLLDATVELLLDEQKRGLAFDLVEPCSLWSFYDDGAEPPATWRDVEFDDSQWKSGRGVLGYGDVDDTTTLEFGPDAQRKHLTAYFRRKFEAKPPESGGSLTLGLSCDDGAAVYLNGQEVARQNLKPDAKHSDAALTTSTDDGLPRHYFTVDAKLLRVGTNALAVEVHQGNPTSSDLRFDLTLSTAPAAK